MDELTWVGSFKSILAAAVPVRDSAFAASGGRCMSSATVQNERLDTARLPAHWSIRTSRLERVDMGRE